MGAQTLYIAGQTPKSVTALANLKNTVSSFCRANTRSKSLICSKTLSLPRRPDSGHSYAGAESARTHPEDHRGFV